MFDDNLQALNSHYNQDASQLFESPLKNEAISLF